VFCIENANALQVSESGQRPHLGFLGVQTPEPRSMMASLKSPGLSVGRMCCKRLPICLRPPTSCVVMASPKYLENTRMTLPSMAGTASP